MPRGQSLLPRRHFTWMRKCCGQATCYKNFLDLADRLTTSDNWEPLVEYWHADKDGDMVKTIPSGYKWLDYAFDYWDFRQQQRFQNRYTTSLEVNRCGNNKVYCNWRVSVKYKGRYMQQNLTRNMVDISLTIPSLNITKEEHFCFKYFNYRTGSPHTLVPHILKEAVGTIYDDYFVNNLDQDIIKSRRSYICDDNCNHTDWEGVDTEMKLMIPQWFMDANYPEGCLIPCVSICIVLLSLTT